MPDSNNYPDSFKEKYPEHAKLEGRKEEFSDLMQFATFLQNNGMLTKIEYYKDEYDDEQMSYKSLDPIKVVTDYFDIDYKKWMLEKDKMLQEIRQGH